MCRRLDRRSSTADTTELDTLAPSLEPGAVPLHDEAASCSPAACAGGSSFASSSASSASMIHGGLLQVAHATAECHRLVSVSGCGALTERMYHLT